MLSRACLLPLPRLSLNTDVVEEKKNLFDLFGFEHYIVGCQSGWETTLILRIRVTDECSLKHIIAMPKHHKLYCCFVNAHFKRPIPLEQSAQ